MSLPIPSSAEITRFSTFSDSVTVGSGLTLERDTSFWDHALIVQWKVHTTSSANWSAHLYTSSNKAPSTFIGSRSSITYQYDSGVFAWPGVVYRDTDNTARLHWSAINNSFTSSITATIWYEVG